MQYNYNNKQNSKHKRIIKTETNKKETKQRMDWKEEEKNQQIKKQKQCQTQMFK